MEPTAGYARSVPEREIDRLYGLPLEEFTSARNKLAGELNSSGDSAAAARVRKLAKPTRSAGAINRAVRRNRRDARGLLSAADKLRQAHEQLLKDGGRRAVDKAAEAERAAVERLMTLVEVELGRDGRPSGAMLDRARSTLDAVARTPELREEFEAGRLTKDHRAVGFGGLSAEAGPSRARAARSAGKKEARRRLQRAERDLEAAERALRRSRKERDAAEEQLTAADATMARRERDVADAVSARDDARESLERT
jgi:hypothetical protein